MTSVVISLEAFSPMILASFEDLSANPAAAFDAAIAFSASRTSSKISSASAVEKEKNNIDHYKFISSTLKEETIVWMEEWFTSLTGHSKTFGGTRTHDLVILLLYTFIVRNAKFNRTKARLFTFYCSVL